MLSFLSVVEIFQVAGFRKIALAAVGTTLAAVGAAFASFFSDETTAEGCETVWGYDVSISPVIR